MASGNSLSLLLWLFTILLVLECSNADGYQGLYLFLQIGSWLNYMQIVSLVAVPFSAEYLGRKKGSKVEKDVSLHKVRLKL